MREPHQRTAVNFAFEPWLAGEPIRSEPAPECLLSMHRVARHVNDHRARDSERTAVFAVAENRASQTARDASGIETWCFRYACGSRRAAPVWTPSVRPKCPRDQSIGEPTSGSTSYLTTYIASTLRISHSESTSAAPSLIGDGRDFSIPPPPVPKVDGLANSGPPMPIRNAFRLVDLGRYGPSTAISDSSARFRRSRRYFPGLK